jgi:hypothetical protein
VRSRDAQYFGTLSITEEKRERVCFPGKAQEKEGGFTMKRKLTVLDLLIGAMEKLSWKTGARQNVLAFIQSCYGGRVLCYDLELALDSLAKLTPEEQHCLITWTLLEKDAELQVGTPAAA